MSIVRRLVPLVLILGAVVALALLSGCPAKSGDGRRNATDQRKAASPEDTRQSDTLTDAGISGKDYRFQFPEQGPRVWVLDVKSFRADAKTGTMELTGVTCQLFTDGRETLSVKAGKGQARKDGSTAIIELSENVRATEKRRDLSLSATDFQWNSEEDHITASGVRWQGMGFVHRADRGEFSTDLARAEFAGNIISETQ